MNVVECFGSSANKILMDIENSTYSAAELEGMGVKFTNKMQKKVSLENPEPAPNDSATCSC